MAKKYQNAQQADDGKWYVYDDESGDRIQVIPISRMDEDGNMVQSFEPAGAGDQTKEAAMQLMGYNQARDAAAAPVNWTEPLPSAVAPFTVTANQETIRPGDIVPAATVADIQQLGLSPMSSPVETTGLQEYLAQTGMSLPEFQAATGSQPFVFNNNGTAVYDPSAQTTKYEYTPASYAQNAMIGLGGIGLLAAAPAIMGALGAAPAAAAGAGAADAATAAAVESFLNTAPVTFGAEAAAPSLLSTGTLATTPVSALSGLGSVLPAGGYEALMAGAGAGAALPTITPSFGEFSSTFDIPTQPSPFVADTTPSLGNLTGPTTPSNVDFTSIINGDVPSMADTINTVTSGGGINMPTLSQTGASLGLPAGGLEAIMGNTPLTMPNPVTGVPTTLSPSGTASVPQTGGAAPNLGTQTPVNQITPPTTAPQSATSAQTLSRLLKEQFGIDIDPGTLDLLGTGASSLLGMYSANQQAESMNDLYNRFFDLGAPYRQSLAQLEANPNSFYQSDMFKGALQQGSDAMARSLSAKVGNPILNPTALQEMQNYTTRGALDAYNNRFNQLASAGQLGVSQSAPLGLQAANAQGGTANALGAGIQSVFGNQPDYAQQLLSMLQNRNSLGGYSLA